MRKHLFGLTAVGVALVCLGTIPAVGSDCPVPGVKMAAPEHGDAIPNIGVIEGQIKAYYGDTVTADGRHVPSPTGSYAKEVAAIEAEARTYLAAALRDGAQQAIVLDVDDTSLNTYNYEVAYSFGYDKAAFALYVTTEMFPAVFGMPELANWAAEQGYTVYFITGRAEELREATVRNLQDAGFSKATTQHMFFRERKDPLELSCPQPRCSTQQYKTGTRALIDANHVEIVANFGDQCSDLEGGHATRTFKLPNPMYYLP